MFDAQDRLEVIRELGHPLAALDAVLDWNLFQPVLDRIPCAEPKGPGGRPAYPPLPLFKILVRQTSYGLGDEQTQFQILDRRGFSNFLGLTEADQVPDQNIIREFREKLTRADPFSELLSACKTRLTEQGIIARKAQIIDASFVEVTAASTHDSQVLDSLTRPGDPETWADSTYTGEPCAAIFEAKGITTHVSAGDRVGPEPGGDADGEPDV